MNVADVAIDRNAEVPISVQLAWALRSRIGEGALVPGQRLPGLRDLAEATGVNVNTVRAVYQRLEQEGLIDSQQGSGTFVAAGLRRASAVGTIAASAAREALETGVDPRDVAAALYTSPKPSPGPDEEAAARRRLLRAQIGALERTLSEMEASHPGVAPPAVAPPLATAHRGVGRTGPTGPTGPSLLSAEELEQVRTLLVRRLASVQAAIDAQLEGSAGDGDPPVAPRRSRSRSGAAKARDKARAEARDKAQDKAEAEAKATSEATRAPRRRAGTTRPAPAGA